MAAELIQKTDRSALGTVFMIVSVVVYSLIPLMVPNGSGGDSPFLFVAGRRFGVALGLTVFLYTF